MAFENLDEMALRRTRQVSAAWGRTYLEDPVSFIWKPETLCYTDIATGHEVWVLVRAPRAQTYFSKEYATTAWSHDGSKIGFWIARSSRGTNNPSVYATDFQRWIVHASGRYLRACEGYAPLHIPEGGFGWANTESAYYGFGSGTTKDGVDVGTLCKMTVGSQCQVVTASQILNTFSAANGDSLKYSFASAVGKAVMKRAISNDDNWMLVYGLTSKNYNRTLPLCRGIMRIQLNAGVGSSISKYWGINRNVQEYDNHNIADEERSHGGSLFALGSTRDKLTVLYSAAVSDHIWYQLQASGTEADGGPKTEAWDGDSYGAGEVFPISSGWNLTPTPDGPFHHYWGHPSFDRWGKYMVWGDGEPSQYVGTRVTLVDPTGVTDTTSGYDGAIGHVDRGISSNAQYDGRHHAWDAWADAVIFFPYYVGAVQNDYNLLYCSKLNFDTKVVEEQIQVCSTHHYPGGNYFGIPRPSQSPDGTKVCFHANWLNGDNDSDDSYPYLTWAVVYWPKPAKSLAASKVGGGISLSWAPPTYTRRGYPTDVDPVPTSKEAKGYHVWRSSDGGATWTEVTTVAVASPLTITQADGTTRDYAVTTEEQSTLESRTLSEIIRCTIDGAGVLTTSIVAVEGTTGFWTTAPAAPTGFTGSLVQATPSWKHYSLSWTAPADSKIRYHNVYYSSVSSPTATQQNRVASIPVGETAHLDWCPDQAAYGYYALTAVDRYGNESLAATWTDAPTPPPPPPPGNPVLFGILK